MEMHFATVWESLADTIGDADAIVQGSQRYDWSSYDREASRFAGMLRSLGVGQDAKVGLYLYNSPEYLISQFGAMKERAVPININYRYLDDELAYLLDNADIEVLVYHASLADRVDRVRERSTKLKGVVEVNDSGSPTHVALPNALTWADVSATAPASRITRSESDLYMLYTGGTTGMPKGVMYEMGGICGGQLLGYPVLAQMAPPTSAAAIAPTVAAIRNKLGQLPRSLPACPLMHGTGVWVGAFIPQHLGSAVVLLEKRNFDADELWQVVERENVSLTTIVGDAFAKPMLRALTDASDRGTPYNVAPLKMILSAGVMWSTEVKQGLLEFGDFVLADLLGSSEASMGNSMMSRSLGASTAKFTASETTKVFIEDGDNWRSVVPGSGEIGMVAAGGNTPLGYYKDEAKSDRTFRTIDGVRYSFPGDMAMIEADGALILLGRGSNCINTAGEKVFPEEVEEAVKRHEAIFDCLVVGVADEKFGERVVAVASVRPGFEQVAAEVIIAHTKTQLASFKAPKQVILVSEVRRAPNGKADYAWAKETALQS
jgi:3-oxocholest-4-en-26-oate---CoA ligase